MYLYYFPLQSHLFEWFNIFQDNGGVSLVSPTCEIAHARFLQICQENKYNPAEFAGALCVLVEFNPLTGMILYPIIPLHRFKN
jgi:hypothetical protein